ncbi:DUF1648 domain-containing protein [Kitasatospora paracochleata]|uniref:Membrane protein n=1 Tax=Kitasatospora paracochleata TaxID=58354 RepID=A0ABT1IVM3_9ACTN|nr:DUF5808 domain-containing protein [Kitasatospora paracochleata]MCP2308983.1 putative membrane protein [Kitasatospora paracochleata]
MAVVVSGALVPGFVLVLSWLMPSLTPPDLQFGVRIPAARRQEAVIADQLRSYRRWLAAWGAAVLVAGCALALAVGDRNGGAAVAAALLPALAALAVTLAGYVRARRVILAAKRAGGWYDGLRQGVAADTSLRTGPRPFPWLWALPPVLLTAATAVIGAVRYDAMPQRLPMHFGGDGTVDRFAEKSFAAAFTPVLSQLGLTVLILAVVWAVQRGRADLDPARPTTSAARHRRYVARLGAALLVMAASVDLSMLLAALKIWSGARTVPPVPLLAPVVFGLAVVTVVAVRTGQGGTRLRGGAADGTDGPDEAAEPDTGLVHADDDRHWRAGGTVYVNRQDPAMLVPKRFGIGWTVNLGNPRAVLLLALVAALVVVLSLAG